MTELGPLSHLLEAELRTKTRRNGIVVWLDPDSHYSGFIDQLIRLRGQTPSVIPYPVHTYRGSFLELILALEPVGNGVDRPPLLIHLPGFNRDTVKGTPLLEFYEAGTAFEKQLEKLISDAAAGHVLPQQIDAFQASGRVSLGNADQWLHHASHSQGRGSIRCDRVKKKTNLGASAVHALQLGRVWPMRHI